MANPKTDKNVAPFGNNYITANRFYVEMDKTLVASFSECQGMGVTIKKETYFEGGVNDQQRVILGQAEFSDVTLKHGMSEDVSFWAWMNTVLNPGAKLERRNVNILLFNPSGERLWCWTLIGAVPVRWQSPSLQADGSAVAVEELSLAYEGIKVETPNPPEPVENAQLTIQHGRDQAAAAFPSN